MIFKKVNCHLIKAEVRSTKYTEIKFVVFTLIQGLVIFCSQWWIIVTIALAKTMEHVTTIWKTTLALVLRNLQDKTVKVCLVFVYSYSHYFHTVFFPCNFFFVLIVFHASPILKWLKIKLLCAMFIDTALSTAKNHCYSSPCQNRGNCSNLPDTFKCTCHPGFTGQNCEGEL